MSTSAGNIEHFFTEHLLVAASLHYLCVYMFCFYIKLAEFSLE